VLGNITTVLGALLVLGSAWSILERSRDYGLDATGHVVSAATSPYPAALLGRPPARLPAEGEAWSRMARSPVVQSTPECHAMAGSTSVWVKLTEPGGGPIHINVGQITSVRSDTQIPGAKAQLDLTSGKFQAVREDIDVVMRMITTAASLRVNGECA